MKRLFNYDKVRFTVAGAFNTVSDFALLNIFVFLFQIPSLFANGISVVICVTISYFLNHYFVFQHSRGVTWRKFMSFFVVTGFSSIVLQSIVIWGVESLTSSPFGRSLFIISSLHDHPQIELNIAKALAVGVGMVWNYVLYKYVVFRYEPTDERNKA